MQWFKHDTDAATDAKIKKLVMRIKPVYGYSSTLDLYVKEG
jgi:hypothetical protein